MKQKKCKCGGLMVPIQYGLPGASLIDKAEKGEVYLGGCVIERNAPTAICIQCGKTKGKLKF